jgi:hypothetical protein
LWLRGKWGGRCILNDALAGAVIDVLTRQNLEREFVIGQGDLTQNLTDQKDLWEWFVRQTVLIAVTLNVARHGHEGQGVEVYMPTGSDVSFGHDIHHGVVRQDGAVKLSKYVEFSRKGDATSTLDGALVEEMLSLFGGRIAWGGACGNYRLAIPYCKEANNEKGGHEGQWGAPRQSTML